LLERIGKRREKRRRIWRNKKGRDRERDARRKFKNRKKKLEQHI